KVDSKLDFVRELLRSYDYLLQIYFFIHEIAQISHNGIKPDNLAMHSSTRDQNALPLIFDFGVSKWSWEDDQKAVGTYGYFDPYELHADKSTGPADWLKGKRRHSYRSDEWSLAMTFAKPVAPLVVSSIIARAKEQALAASKKIRAKPKPGAKPVSPG
ncbi:unnamed protein product, partial [Amoebophrya sp. A25]